MEPSLTWRCPRCSRPSTRPWRTFSGWSNPTRSSWRLLLLGGSLGDRFGRRKIFAVGVAMFFAASAWCGLATGIGQLIVARGVQGAGGAARPRQPGADQRRFSEKEARPRDRWSASRRSQRDRPVLGGWFIGTVMEMGVFHQSSDRAGSSGASALVEVPESRAADQSGQFDWLGGVLAAIGLGGIVFALIESAVRRGWLDSPDVTVVLGARPRRLSRSTCSAHVISAERTCSSLLSSALSGLLFFFPPDLIVRHSPHEAGAALLPFILLMFLLSRFGPAAGSSGSPWREALH